MNAVPVKNSSDKELRRLYDAATQLKAAKSDSFDTLWYSSRSWTTRHGWSGRSLVVNTKVFHRVLSSLNSYTSKRDSLRVFLRSDINTLPDLITKCLLWNSSYAISTDDACLACKKRWHQIHTCSVFKGRIWADRVSVVKDLGLCMNCLRAGHIAEKCRAPLMCKKCTRYHHTLLHRDADNVTHKEAWERGKLRRRLM